METYFRELTAALWQRLRPGEVAGCWLSGELSDFVRFNRGKVRQAGCVEQATLGLKLTVGQRQAGAELALCRALDADLAALEASLDALRGALVDLPDDPHLLYSTEPGSVRSTRDAALPPADAMVDDVVAAAAGRDLVGLLASGPVFRGFASSLGHLHWHQATSALLDYSLYLRADQAVKDSYAGFSWRGDEVRARVDEAARRLDLMARPPRPVPPGRYRVFLAPAAMAELMSMLTWGGFSTKALRTKQSALLRLHDGEASLSPRVTLSELTAEGLAPAFQAEGFVKPPRVPLVEAGRFAGALISPRTAREYGLLTNGAGAAETPEALDMAAGDLPSADALAALGTGLWIGNLWYLNYSDRGAGRVTGMTRFATFWVEQGQIVGPAPVMRFDDSIYDLLGPRLEALTSERELLPDATSYGERQTTSMRLPGALLSGLTLTL